MIGQPTKRIFAIAMIMALLLDGVALSLRGHESPEHEVEALTLRMTRIGKTASLLGRRAAEYKALGELDKAAADLTEAIALDPKAAATYGELSKVQFAQEKLNEAYENATRSLALMEDGADRSPMYLLRAQI